MLAELTVLLAAATPITEVRDAYPDISPDGRTIVFQSNRSGRNALYLADINGGNLRVLLDSGDDPVTPAWSPDGTKIAFAATAEGQSEIFVIDADGSVRKRLTDDPGDDSHPHWTPDGRIIFNSPRNTPDPSADWSDQWHDVYTMTADGADLRQHTECKTVCTFPSASPDGTRIAYRKVIAAPGINWEQAPIERNSEIFVANIDGSNERNLSKSPAFDGWPRWSPDGNSIVFASNRAGVPFASHIYVVDVETGAVSAVTDGAWSGAQPVFAPNGETVFFYRFRESADFEFGHIGAVRVTD